MEQVEVCYSDPIWFSTSPLIFLCCQFSFGEWAEILHHSRDEHWDIPWCLDKLCYMDTWPSIGRTDFMWPSQHGKILSAPGNRLGYNFQRWLIEWQLPLRSSEKFNLPRTQHRKHLPIKNMSKQMFRLAWKRDLNATVIIGFSWITTIWNQSPNRRM